ncbi:MAG TPA: NUDIX hydrolase [Candidatus Paceibacterota bacterium]
MKHRVAGIVIKDGEILLMHRVKNGKEYYVFPGGCVESGESREEVLKRELKEELGLSIDEYEFAFEFENEGQAESYYLVKKFTGTVELGGPEKERMCEDNQYYPEWFKLLKAVGLKNLFPKEALNRLRRLPETHPSPEYFKALPKKRMASGVLLFNQRDELLVIKPSYKDHWSIPGGVVEENESPKQAAIREAKEEIGVEIKECQLLCLDYVSYGEGKDDSLQFIFYGGVLEDNKINIDQDEIEDYKFLKIDDALSFLSKKLEKRLSKSLEAIKEDKFFYLESQE